MEGMSNVVLVLKISNATAGFEGHKKGSYFVSPACQAPPNAARTKN
jgi:hypothetical protein